MALVSRFALSAALAALVTALPLAQGRPPDGETLLAGPFGFSPAEIQQARAGQAVTKPLTMHDQIEVGVAGAVYIPGSPDRLVAWFKDIAGFRRSAELGVAKKIGAAPQLADFAGVSLSAADLAALQSCRPGKCDLRLGDAAIARFQSDVNWSAPDAGSRANALTRQLLHQLTSAYLTGGDVALGTAHNEKTPRVSADEFHALLYQATNLYQLAPAFAGYLEHFPRAAAPNTEQFLYWAVANAGPESTISLHQVFIYTPPGGSALLADKQLYASRYTDAALTIIALAPSRTPGGYYATVVARGRSTMLGGIAARLLRSRVQAEAASTAAMYLNWVQQSLSMSR